MTPQSTPLAFDWKKNYSADIALWAVDGPGHTPDSQRLTKRHVVPAAGGALVIAAQLGQLDLLDTHAMLTSVRAKQNPDPTHPRFGNVCFHYEDKSVQDGNAGFFLGQSLAIIALEFAHLLPAPARELLFTIVKDLAFCMNHDARKASSYYPNKHLGDIVVAHLLSQAIQDTAGLQQLDELLLQLADRYLGHTDSTGLSHPPGWGWGEDLSDIYSKILLDELSIFLCVSKILTPSTRQACTRMLHHLIALEDQFTPGPRVPAIRTYSFFESPQKNARRNYRDIVQPWTQSTIPPISHVPQTGPLLHARNWHSLVPPRLENLAPSRSLNTPLFGGKTAYSRIEPDCRLGSTSRFPLMDSAEHHPWGLAWQSMPVTFFHQQGDWAYLQFFCQTADNPAAHPAMISNKTDPTRVFRALTPNIHPPVAPKTHTLFHEQGLLALRVVPCVTLDWQHFGDRFRIIAPSAELTHDAAVENYPRLHMQFPNRRVTLALLDPWRQSQPTLTRDENRADFGVRWEPSQLARRRGIVLLWAIGLSGLPDQPPTFTTAVNVPVVPRAQDEEAFTLDWHWPGHHWRVTIDPLSATPMVELS